MVGICSPLKNLGIPRSLSRMTICLAVWEAYQDGYINLGAVGDQIFHVRQLSTHE